MSISKTGEFTNDKLVQNFKALTGDYGIKEILLHEGTLDVGTLADGAGSTHQFTVNGVALGDIVLGVSLGVDVTDHTITGYVQAANTVEVRVQNESGSGSDFASTTVRILVADVT